MIRVFSVLIGVLGFVSCTVHEMSVAENVSSDCETATVSFNADVQNMVKSSVTLDESALRNINVYAFKDGVLVDEVYSLKADGIMMNLPANSTYNIYAVANIGLYHADVSEERFLSDASYAISGIRILSRGVPMRCAARNVYVGRESQAVDLRLERMAAKVNLSVDKSSLLSGLQVNSVRLCQSASIVYPFRWEKQGGSRVTSEDETFDGDYATSADLRRLNTGGEVTFYTLENCQGILLPDNTSPELKVPKMIQGKEKLCSYLEIECDFDGSGLFEGDVRYRIYLGLDECTSFDVPGNACINVSLSLTGEGLKTLSWKVNADVDVRDGYVSGEVDEGMHGMNDLYVGEVLLYEVVLTDEIIEYLGGDASGSSVRLVRDGVEVEGLMSDNLQGNGPVVPIQMRCVAPGEGQLYLYDPEGKRIGLLEPDVCIRLPEIVFSEYSSAPDDEPVEPLSFIPECDINGDAAHIYVYLTDSQGYSLTGSRSYGFDGSLFDFCDMGTYSEGVLVDAVRADFNEVEPNEGAPATCMELSCVNPGRDHEENLLLTAIHAAERTAVLTVADNNHDMTSSLRVGLGIPRITLSLVDNGWAGYHSCQLSMKVDNPSNLPLDVSVWQLMTTNASYGPVDADYVEDNLEIDHIEYMTGEFYNGAPPLYGSCSSFYSERNEEGDQALNDGSWLVYPLEDISTEDLISAVNYNRRGNGQMMHMVDVTLSGRPVMGSDVRLEDNVSNGSSQYDYIYYSQDSWNYRGAGLCTDDALLSHPDNWSYDYPNLTPLRLDRLAGRWDDQEQVCVSMLYVPDEGRLSVMTFAGIGAQYGLTLTFGYSGAVNGYVQTYPKGTWGAAQENRCSADVSHSKTGVPLLQTGQFVWADDGGLKSAMDEIYGHSYKDSDRPLGADAYMHHAHPTDMRLTVDLLVEGDEGDELYPFYMTWDADYLEYYHEQEGKTYKCSLNPAASAYKLSVVRHK